MDRRPDMKAMNLLVEKYLHKEFKSVCAMNDETMLDAIKRFMKKTVEESKK